MTEVLDFNLAKAGYFSSLPPLARLICGFGFGSLGDMLRRKEIFSVTAIRKSFCLFCEFMCESHGKSKLLHENLLQLTSCRDFFYSQSPT